MRMSVDSAERDLMVRAASASVGIAAGLLACVAVLARRIEHHAMEIEAVLWRTRDDTRAIPELSKVNAGLEQLTSELRNRRAGVET